MAWRTETRIPQVVLVLLTGEGMVSPETALTENISRHGVRVLTRWNLPLDYPLAMVSSEGDLRAHARVIYCYEMPGHRYAAGLQLLDAAGRWLRSSSSDNPTAR